ncbi:unnamed protein product, partial [Ectocarpus sp. 13 AM-2016]
CTRSRASPVTQATALSSDEAIQRNIYAGVGVSSSIMQKFVLSGGLGLLGQRVLQHIVSSGHGCVRVMIVDTAPVQAAKSSGPPTAASGITGDPAVGNGANGEVLGSSTARGAVSVVRGDLSCSDVAAAIKSFAGGDDGGGDHAETASSTLSVFHLASVMSGQGEEDFGEALRVNIDGTRSLLDTCRQIGGRPRFVFASSIAAFGGGEQVTDETKLLPQAMMNLTQSTYGMTKACAELLVNDCTRKGFVDGRIARLPTVVVRPGPPNPAATGCFSSVPKAVLHGQHFISPVSHDLRHACVGLSSAVDGLIRLHDASEADFGPRDRSVHAYTSLYDHFRRIPKGSILLRAVVPCVKKRCRDWPVAGPELSMLSHSERTE